jgi:hypothetical protein
VLASSPLSHTARGSTPLDVVDNLLSRLPDNINDAQVQPIRHAAATAKMLKGKIAEANARTDLSPSGRAQFIRDYVAKTIAPILKHQRDAVARDAANLEAMRIQERNRAIGAADPLDRERRDFLRTLTEGERSKIVLSDPDFRGAALRGGATLSGLHSELFERALAAAMPADTVSALNTAAEANSLHESMVRVLQDNVANAMGIETALELDRFLNTAKAA